MTQAISDTQTCTCGGIIIESNGFNVCSSCGECHSKVYSTEQYVLKNESIGAEENNSRGSRQYVSAFDSMKRTTRTLIGKERYDFFSMSGKKRLQFLRLQRMNQFGKRESNRFTKHSVFLYRIAKSLQLSEQVTECALYLLRQGLKNHRNGTIVAIAALTIACRIHRVAILERDIIDYADRKITHNKATLTKAKFELMKIVGSIPTLKPVDFLSNLFAYIKKSPEIVRRMKDKDLDAEEYLQFLYSRTREELERFENSKFFKTKGYSRRIIAVCVTYCVDRYFGSHCLTYKDLHKCASESTIRYQIKNFWKGYFQL